MTQSASVSAAKRRMRLPVALLMVTLFACDLSEPLSNTDPEPRPGARQLGLVEITINGIGTSQMTSSVIAAPDFASLVRLRAQQGSASPFSSVLTAPTNADLSGDGTIELEPVSTGSFTTGARGADGQRYIQAVFRVRNAPSSGGVGYDTERQNLTFLAVDTDGTLGETAISQLATFGGTPIAGAEGIALAESMIPTGAARLTPGGALASDYPDVLQVITEAEAASVDLSSSPDVNGVFPYGFVTRCVSNCTPSSRILPANPAVDQFDGVITFAFRVPLQASASEDPYSISVVFLATDDTDTRITESPEDRLTGTAALQQAAAELGNPTVTLLGNSSSHVPVVGMRRICTVRTAGNDPMNPVATLVDAGAACTTGLASNVRAVDADAAPGGDGLSWATAFSTLQDALECVRSDVACAGVNEVWVAEGVYYPDEGGAETDGDTSARFALIDGVGIYGGFAGTEYSRDQRDWQARPTILSGDIDQDDPTTVAATPFDIAGDNSRVLLADGTVNPIGAATVLDGFTITAGYSDDETGGLMCDGSGGECSPTLRNLVFSGNFAGTGVLGVGGLGIVASGGGIASPHVENVAFTGNAGLNAGAAYIRGSGGSTIAAVFLDTRFEGNYGPASALRVEGSASTVQPVLIGSVISGNNVDVTTVYTVYSLNSAVRLINTEVVNNQQTAGGATIALQGGSPVLTNTTVAGNSNGVLTGGTTAGFNNVVIWGNGVAPFSNPGAASTVTLSHAIVEGGCPALAGYTCTNVIDADPQFVDLAAGDVRLGLSSPGVDAGNNSLLPVDTYDVDGDGNTAEPLPLDLAGMLRVVDWGGLGTAVVDLGAYERQ